MTRQRTARGGFTLVEVALSLGIVAFSLIPLLGLMSSGLRISRDSIDRTVQAMLFSQVASDLSQTDYSKLPTSVSRYFDADAHEVAAGSSSLYQVDAAVSKGATLPGAATTSNSLAQVTMTLTRLNAPREPARFATLIANNGR